MVHFYGWGSTVLRLQSHDKETLYFTTIKRGDQISRYSFD